MSKLNPFHLLLLPQFVLYIGVVVVVCVYVSDKQKTKLGFVCVLRSIMTPELKTHVDAQPDSQK